ncbi:hypothetical protein FO519_003991 [Halicephalobus sp. NKZ332]|nr:hypothetical protein FO519_003991 [Halicephalobus sp. NKZ332]
MQRIGTNFSRFLLRQTLQGTTIRGLKKVPSYVKAKDLRRKTTKSTEIENDPVAAFPSTSAEKNPEVSQITPEDEKLINRGDFYGVRPSSQEAEGELAPEVIIGKLKEMLDNNLRFNAEFFLMNILLPIEKKNQIFLNMVNLAPESYIPLFIKCCGLVMSDVPEENRLFLLERLLKALKSANVNLNLSSYNALLETWLENGYSFDVDDVLKNAELDRNLNLDVRFFNNLLWGMAIGGKEEKMKNLLLEMSKRGVMPDFESELPQIYAAAFCGFEQKCSSLISRALQRYGEDKKQACVSAEIRGVAAARNLPRLRGLLRNNVTVKIPEESLDFTHKKNQKARYIIDLPYDVTFDVIWQLAKRSTFGDGQEFAALTEQILEHAQRTTGYFKRLFRETERHVAHEFYYSAAVLITETGRVKEMLQSQRKSLFRNQIFPRICHQLVRKQVEADVIWDISNRLSAAFGPDTGFYDHLLYAILTFKGYRYDERFDTFSQFVDTIDVDRTRPHLLFPIFARCPDLQSRQKILFRATLLGYKDVSQMDPWMMMRFFYLPMLNNLVNQMKLTDVERLIQMSKVMESFGVKPIHTWKLVFKWAQSVEENQWKYSLPIERNHLKKWLTLEYERLFSDKEIEIMDKNSKLPYEVFQKLMKSGDVEKVHNFLVKRGDFPPGMNFSEDLDPLLELYLQNANWGYVKKLLNLLSSVNSDDGNNFSGVDEFPNEKNGENNESSPVKNHHLLKILKRYFLECENIQLVIEFVYELKRMFPYSVAEHETRFESIRAYESFFQTILGSSNGGLTPDKVNEAIDLVTLLIKLDIMMLHGNEILTLSFVEKVLYLANAFLAGAYVSKGQINEAEKIFQSKEYPLQSSDYLNIFRLLQLRRRHEIALEYSKLCLKYTDLRKNKHGCHLFISYWLWLCEFKRLGIAALDFYELFRSYDVPLTLVQMERLDKICQNQKEIITKWTIDEKKKVLKESKKDPASKEIHVDRTVDNTIMEMLKDLAKKHPQNYISDFILLRFLFLVSKNSSPEVIGETAAELRRVFPLQGKQNSKRLKIKNRQYIIKIFQAALGFKDSTFNKVSNLCDKLIELGFLSSREVFLETATCFFLKSKKFKEIFPTWSSHCLSEHTTAGGQFFFEYALTDKKVPKIVKQKRIRNILEVYEKVRNPADGLSQLIISMVLTNNFDDARILWTKLSIDCIHFVRPIRNISREENLADVNSIHIQQIGNLITECVLDEMEKSSKGAKEGGKNRVSKSEEVSQEQSIPESNVEDGLPQEKSTDKEELNEISDSGETSSTESPLDPDARGNVGFLLDKFRVFRRRRFVKSKTRKFTVKADQLEKLLIALQDVWIKIAETNRNAEDLDSLCKFMEKNNLLMTERNKQRVELLYESLKKPEGGEKSFEEHRMKA